MKSLLSCVLLLAGAMTATAAKNLEVYFIDVEGGQATLFVSPSGESLLVDTGWSGHNHRDAQRIALAAKAAGVKRIDYLVITHYHVDHVGGIEQLVQKLPVRNFIDHGPSGRDRQGRADPLQAYLAQREKGTHIEAKPGDRLPIKGIDVQVVASAGKIISAPLPGAGQPNPECASFHRKEDDPSENAQSVAMKITFGSFQMVDLGDLTWNKEYELVCPANKIGTVDLYLVSHHGMDMSGSPQLVHALHPRVAVMNNGARKGGVPEIWKTVHASPGLLDLWQLHFSVAGREEANSSDTLIANVDEICEGKWLKMTVKTTDRLRFTTAGTNSKRHTRRSRPYFLITGVSLVFSSGSGGTSSVSNLMSEDVEYLR